ncbi:MAG: hypothetical protein ABI980_11200 [Nitrospirota bacterium]
MPETDPFRRIYAQCRLQPYKMIHFVMAGLYRRLLPAAFRIHDR